MPEQKYLRKLNVDVEVTHAYSMTSWGGFGIITFYKTKIAGLNRLSDHRSNGQGQY
jgi:hypothetical protein